MNDAALLDSLHAALRNPDLAWYTAWMEHWNEYEYSITHHIDWNGKGFTPYDLYCTQDLTGMIADGSLASIREDARTIFKDRPLTDDCLFANSIWPEPELLGLVDDLTGRTGRNL